MACLLPSKTNFLLEDRIKVVDTISTNLLTIHHISLRTRSTTISVQFVGYNGLHHVGPCHLYLCTRYHER